MKPLRFQLYVPSIQLGPLSFDPLKTLLGTSWGDVLRPVNGGESQAVLLNGNSYIRYPLTFGDGVGFHLSLNAFGEVSLFNDKGLLKVTVPVLLSSALAPYQTWLKKGPEMVPGKNAMAVSSHWYALPPGGEIVLQIPKVGSVVLVAE